MNPSIAKPTPADSAHPSECWLCRLLHEVWKHIPVLLILACAFPLLDKFKPGWLEAIDTATLNYVSYFSFWKSGQDKMLETYRADTWGLETTVLTLTPNAYRDFLNRESPVPRERLACLIDELAQQIGKLRAGSNLTQAWKPVVGIDVDVTTVEQRREDGKPGKVSTSSASWPKDVALSECKKSLARAPQCATATIDDAMRCALRKLAKEAIVIAIVYPRGLPKPMGPVGAPASQQKPKPDTAITLRNQFIDQMCACTGPACPRKGREVGASQGYIYFASPHLMYPALDMVYDFASSLKEPNGQLEAEGLAALPQRFPGLGQAIAAALRHHSLGRRVAPSPTLTQADEADQSLLNHYCVGKRGADGTLLDDLLFDTKWQYRLPGAYAFEPIALGRVKPMVVGFDVEPDFNTDVASGLSNQVAKALESMPLTDVYVLSIDAGTTEDKFQVPTMKRLQSGGWVHGAIAATLFTADSNSAKDRAMRERGSYVHHVLVDVACGLALVLWCLPLLAWCQTMGPVSSHVVRFVGPALGIMGIVYAYLALSVSPDFLEGKWANPAPMLLGLLVHWYFDQPEIWGDGSHQAPETAFEIAHRVLWQTIGAGAMIGSFAIGVGFEPPKVFELGRLPSALGLLLLSAVVYVALAHLRYLRFLPLTWR